MINIALVDDHASYRQSLKCFIEHTGEFKVTLEAEDGLGLVNLLEFKEVDIILLDLSMPEQNGIVTCKEICDRFPEQKVIALSAYEHKFIAEMLIKNGAKGYLMKKYAMMEILGVIKKIYNGERYFRVDMDTSTLDQEINFLREYCSGQPQLTLTEKQKNILELISLEKTNAEIANELCMAPRTVEYHRKRAIEKTGSRNIIGAVVVALRNNLF